MVLRTPTEKVIYRLNRNPTFLKLLNLRFKYGYRFLSRLLTRDDVLFLNWGYEEDPPMGLPLAASDEPDRLPIQLYHRTAAQVDLKGKQVLEVSCGHGGGASYIMRTMHPASYTGLDLNNVGIEFCRKRHQLPGLQFVQGNAERLPFFDESFDAVINIEAAIHYIDFAGFLNEVARVLRPSGHFLYADLRDAEAVPAWEAALADAPMRMVSEQVINAEVMRGLEDNRLLGQISSRLPKIGFLQKIANDFASGSDSLIYRRLENGDVSYRVYCFVKE
ncbi:methyltransferase domain-containing protein [Mycobacterium shinjukuense]|uniref:Phthiotriol/phenolphthiotriol dimycocerosates methyltransferase n=1 Tax=Mycobacterium shinjukuense TaxID=398694 RepID=A0A7I7MPA8_9MYCO|nr:class I SAM-dependent methyltransferase [Mycobacterium shinjukuense]MCV6983911.1 methyltransferase domain-containing protein [Mycobacterium shinjukuense]ORB62847.1 SAM-dependent methyltransferase [Mycobacterium shinjukuense]BBX73770.1 phthiotriol/phenolphthiotriol dimycocerosates methyltransferase [Mycobacterium shinjukuense]